MSIAAFIFTFIEGMLTFISPCILPMLPIYFVYMAGSVEEVSDSKKSTDLIKNSIGFVIGFTIIFVALGASASALGQFLKEYKDILTKVSAVIMIIFGLNFIGILNLKILNIEKRFNYNYNKPGFLSSIIFGIVFGFSWSYCLIGILGSVLALASNSKTLSEGVFLLFIYSMGLGVPFIISAIIFDKVKDTFKQLMKHGRIISIVSGIILIIAGTLVFMDLLKYLGTF